MLSTQELICSIAVLGFLPFVLYGRGRKQSLPPGPRPLPLVGNWFSLPQKEPWLVYQQWSRQYSSDLIYLNVLGTDVIVVNSRNAAKALFEGKSALYADRPRMTMINELIGLSWHFGFMPHGEAWRAHRAIFNKYLNPASVVKFRDQETKWAQIFLKNLLQKPDAFLTHIQHMASGLALEVSFGLQVQPSGEPDPFIGAATHAIEALGTAGIFGSYLVDYIPLLRYIPTWAPFAGFKRQARDWKVSVDIAETVPFALVKKSMSDGEAAQKSITSELIDSKAFNEDDIRRTSSAMFANGSAAVVSALSTFFLVMSQYPEVQEKAQRELDEVAQDRLPEFSDEASLPYIAAIIKEVLRWNPIVPLAFPHRLSADDTYDGYHLPAGSVVLPNTWAILYDTKVYGSDVATFRPERFLKNGQLDPDIPDPDVAFGYGRRVCPARHMAHSELFITITHILATFNVSEGSESVPKPSPLCTSGLLRYPLPFKCSIQARSSRHANLVASLSP